MSKYGELLALAEIFKKQGADEAKAKPMRTRKEKEVDVLALLEQKRREYEGLKHFVENQHKLNKPEEKKDKGWSIDHIAMFLMAMMPINWAVMYVLLK